MEVVSGPGWSPAEIAYFRDLCITIREALDQDIENTSTEVALLARELASTISQLRRLQNAARHGYIQYSKESSAFAKTLGDCQAFLRRYGPLQLKSGSASTTTSPSSHTKSTSQSIIWSHEGNLEADKLRHQLRQHIHGIRSFLHFLSTMSINERPRQSPSQNLSELDIKHKIVESYRKELPVALVYQDDDDENNEYDQRFAPRFRSSSIYSDSWSFSESVYSDEGSTSTTVTSPGSMLRKESYDIHNYDPRTGVRMNSLSSTTSSREPDYESATTTPRSTAVTIQDQLEAFQLDGAERSQSPISSDGSSLHSTVSSIEIRRRREMARSDSPTLPNSPSFEELPIELMDGSFYAHERKGTGATHEQQLAMLRNIHTNSMFVHSPPNIKSPAMNEKMIIPSYKEDPVPVMPDEETTKFHGKTSIIRRFPGAESRCQLLLDDVKWIQVKLRDGRYRLKQIKASNQAKDAHITHHFEAKSGPAAIPHIDQPLTTGKSRFRVKFLPHAWISIEDHKHKKEETSKTRISGLEYWFEEEDDYIRFQRAVHGRDLLRCLPINEICYHKDKMRSSKPICLTQMLRIWKEPESNDKTMMFFANTEQRYHDIDVAYFSYVSSGSKVTLSLNPNPPQLGEMPVLPQQTRSQSLSTPSISNRPDSAHRPSLVSLKQQQRSGSIASTGSNSAETLDLIFTWREEKWKCLVIEFTSPHDAKKFCELIR